MHYMQHSIETYLESLSTYAKFSEKITFLTPLHIGGLEMLVFRKILRKYLTDGPYKSVPKKLHHRRLTGS